MPEPGHRLLQLRLVERVHDLARDVHALVDLDLRRSRGISGSKVPSCHRAGPRAAAELEGVAEPARGDEPDARDLALQHGVGGGGVPWMTRSSSPARCALAIAASTPSAWFDAVVRILPSRTRRPRARLVEQQVRERLHDVHFEQPGPMAARFFPAGSLHQAIRTIRRRPGRRERGPVSLSDRVPAAYHPGRCRRHSCRRVTGPRA